MRNTKTAWLLVVLLATVGFMAANVSRASEQDEAAVRQATARFYTALNAMLKGDASPVEEVWSHAKDVTYMGADGGYQVGWDQVLVDWEVQADLKIGGKAEPSDVRVTVGKDLAVAHNYVKTERTIAKGRLEKTVLRATSVFRKEDGKWKMIGHHVDTLPYLVKWKTDARPSR
ncbi:MAG: nuclear transport factor 2 family protein [Deltaproteobacteria bacterium]